MSTVAGKGYYLLIAVRIGVVCVGHWDLTDAVL